MIEKYCPCKEMQKLEQELWNPMMKEADVATYKSHFNYLATLCASMVTPGYKKIDRYIWGLPQPIQGLVTASKITTFDSAKRLVFILTYQEIHHGTMV